MMKNNEELQKSLDQINLEYKNLTSLFSNKEFLPSGNSVVISRLLTYGYGEFETWEEEIETIQKESINDTVGIREYLQGFYYLTSLFVKHLKEHKLHKEFEKMQQKLTEFSLKVDIDLIEIE